MIFKCKVSSIYECSLERAFKTPMLCDITKIHTGFGIMPKVSHTRNDTDWGKPGSSKEIFTVKSLTQSGGFSSIDRILERNENESWKFQVDNFQFWVLGFDKFIGEWKTTQIEADKIFVEYSYSLHSKTILLYPINFIFANTFWKTYMKRVLKNVKKMAYAKEPYLYE